MPKFGLKGGETFGAGLLIIAKKRGLAIGKMMYAPPPRRKNPRIGGTIKANLRTIWALLKSFHTLPDLGSFFLPYLTFITLARLHRKRTERELRMITKKD